MKTAKEIEKEIEDLKNERQSLIERHNKMIQDVQTQTAANQRRVSELEGAINALAKLLPKPKK